MGAPLSPPIDHMSCPLSQVYLHIKYQIGYISQNKSILSVLICIIYGARNKSIHPPEGSPHGYHVVTSQVHSKLKQSEFQQSAMVPIFSPSSYIFLTVKKEFPRCNPLGLSAEPGQLSFITGTSVHCLQVLTVAANVLVAKTIGGPLEVVRKRRVACH